MLQVNIDATEENSLFATCRFLIQKMGQVGGQHSNFMTVGHELMGKGIVPHADPAIIVARTGREKSKLHEEAWVNPCFTGSGSSAKSDMDSKSSLKS